MGDVTHKQLLHVLQRFSSRKEYAALRKTCLDAIVEWRSATGPMVPQLPHEKTISGMPPPKWSKKPPRYPFLHGLDSTGRILAILPGNRDVPAETLIEQFLLHENGGYWRIFFEASKEKRPTIVEWIELQDGRWMRELSIGHYCVHERTLTWEADRLVRRLDRNWDNATTGKPTAAAKAKFSEHGSSHNVVTYTYAADGSLQRVTESFYFDNESKPATEEIKYQQLPAGVSLPKLIEEVEELLVAEIPKTVKAAKIKTPMYCMLLQFSGVETDPDGFAPPMFLVPDTTRQKLIAKLGKDRVTDDLWTTPELEVMPGTVELSCADTTLDEKLKLIFQLTIGSAKTNNYTPVRKMFQRVCMRLNQIDWTGILKTTDDFVIFPTDAHGELDVKADVKASVPKSRLQLLVDRGLIWKMKLK